MENPPIHFRHEQPASGKLRLIDVPLNDLTSSRSFKWRAICAQAPITAILALNVWANARTDRCGRSVASELATDVARPRSVQ